MEYLLLTYGILWNIYLNMEYGGISIYKIWNIVDYHIYIYYMIINMEYLSINMEYVKYLYINMEYWWESCEIHGNILNIYIYI